MRESCGYRDVGPGESVAADHAGRGSDVRVLLCLDETAAAELHHRLQGHADQV